MNIGDSIKDNDPRMANRVLTVVRLAGDHVVARNIIGQEFRILVRRIHADGKARRSGFTLKTKDKDRS